MQIGLIGLGKMGSNMVQRLSPAKHQVVGFDLSKERIQQAMYYGAVGVDSLEALVQKLSPPRHIWVMVPHGKPTDETIQALLALLEKDDLIADGGNSYYKDSLSHAEQCRKAGIHFLDIGVSGGVWGLERGYNLMVGGSPEAFVRLEPLLKTLASPKGYAHVGSHGSGHFVKMIHNALEYAMLQAIGESFECLWRSEFDLDLRQIATLWSHGAVVQCWLLELLANVFAEEGRALQDIKGYIEDSGTGRWTVQYAVQHAVPLPTITSALYERFASRSDEHFAYKVIAALRNQFGGHAMKRIEER